MDLLSKKVNAIANADPNEQSKNGMFKKNLVFFFWESCEHPARRGPAVSGAMTFAIQLNKSEFIGIQLYSNLPCRITKRHNSP